LSSCLLQILTSCVDRDLRLLPFSLSTCVVSLCVGFFITRKGGIRPIIQISYVSVISSRVSWWIISLLYTVDHDYRLWNHDSARRIVIDVSSSSHLAHAPLTFLFQRIESNPSVNRWHWCWRPVFPSITTDSSGHARQGYGHCHCHTWSPPAVRIHGWARYWTGDLDYGLCPSLFDILKCLKSDCHCVGAA
jgi:hypothetical protein